MQIQKPPQSFWLGKKPFVTRQSKAAKPALVKASLECDQVKTQLINSLFSFPLISLL